MVETYYDVLGVSRDATDEEITAAYRERVLETHPDRNDDPDTVDAFKRVQDAEAVLSDEAERARYDRLGHAVYVGGETPSRGDGDGGGSRDRSSDDVRDAAARAADRSSREGSDRSGPSYHARQRARRRCATEATGTRASEWFDGTDASDGASRTTARNAGGATGNRSAENTANRSAGTASRSTTKTTSRRATRATAQSSRASSSTARRSSDDTVGDPTDDTAGDGFRYSVHDWTDDIDVSDERPPMDQSTAIGVGALALLYPVLVYSSLTPTFPITVNAVLAACTFVLVAFLLTMPRIALATFGGWSVFASVAAVRSPLVDPFTVLGMLALAAFWVPFGYAIAVWWALRP